MPEPIAPVTRTPRTTPPARRAGLVSVAAVFVILGVLCLLWGQWQEWSAQRYPQGRWQAVFLDNGQVYFGHVRKVTKQSLVLTNIYYLQTAGSQLQPTGGTDEGQKLNLVKLGKEVHGPQDQMVISRNHVLLVENLADQSQVVDLINRSLADPQAGR